MKIEYIWQLVFILLGSLASGYAGYYFGNQPEENSILEYSEHSQKNLKSIFGNVDDISISYKGAELEKISSTRFSILNYTDKNLDEFKLYFEVSDKNSLPLFHSITPPESYPKEAVKLISSNDGIYIFEVEYLNKTEESWRGLDFVFYFSGSEPSKIDVKTGTKGLQIKEFKFGERDSSEFIFAAIQKTWWLLALYIILTYFVLKASKIRKELHKLEIYGAIEESFNNTQGVTNSENIENIKSALKTSPNFKTIIDNWNRDFSKKIGQPNLFEEKR